MIAIRHLLIVSCPLVVVATGLAMRWDLGFVGGAGLFYAGLALAQLGYLLLAIARAARNPARGSDAPALLSPER